MKQIFTILGGDSRQIALAARLAESGAFVRTFGLPEQELAATASPFAEWTEAVAGASVVLLPLPASPDGVRLNLPLTPHLPSPLFSEILSHVPIEVPIIGGKFSPSMKALAQEHGRELIDFCKSEEFQQKNAVPTAEGALSIVMERLPCTICGMSVAVSGFGRIAKALVSILLGMGAQVTVGARKASDLSAARALGCNTVQLCGDRSVLDLAKGKRVIFNTVPHWLFTREVLSGMEKSTLLLDLASAPGGVDAEVARGLGLSVIWALSLPGKYAPETAGQIIADTVLSLLSEEGIV